MPTAAILLLGSYQLPAFRVIKRAGATNMSAYSASLRKAGATSDPMHTIVLPLPAPGNPVSNPGRGETAQANALTSSVFPRRIHLTV